MPRELIAIAPRTPAFREYEEAELGPRQIRIRTEFASPKHGTELVAYRDEPAAQRSYDRTLGAFVPRSADASRFPRSLGNMALGTISDVGGEVSRFRVGDRVFGHFPIRETHTVMDTDADHLPDGLSPEAAVCLDPLVMALPMRDANIKLGDRVAVFGLGAIGLMATQLARLAGAAQVIAVDPLANRGQLALTLGADIALDSLADNGDAGLAVRRLTERAAPPPTIADRSVGDRVLGGYRDVATQSTDLGVEVAVESSGNTRALHQAIRATRYGGTICMISYYGKEATGLHLGEEFHVNRLQLISARAESLPLRDAPGWTLTRLVELALDWLTIGRVRTDGIITPIVNFADAVEAYRSIDDHPEESIKLGITFT